jgi:hypothetical protein
LLELHHRQVEDVELIFEVISVELIVPREAQAEDLRLQSSPLVTPISSLSHTPRARRTFLLRVALLLCVMQYF